MTSNRNEINKSPKKNEKKKRFVQVYSKSLYVQHKTASMLKNEAFFFKQKKRISLSSLKF